MNRDRAQLGHEGSGPGFRRPRSCAGRDRLELDPDAARQDRLRQVLGVPAEPGVRHAAVATLWPDPESPYDSLAVGVWLDGVHVGWLTHADSARVHAVVAALAEAGEMLESAGVIEYVGPDEFGTPVLGAWLPIDLEGAADRAAAVGARPDADSPRARATVPTGGVEHGGG